MSVVDMIILRWINGVIKENNKNGIIKEVVYESLIVDKMRKYIEMAQAYFKEGKVNKVVRFKENGKKED